jgi:hypothetical protein
MGIPQNFDFAKNHKADEANGILNPRPLDHAKSEDFWYGKEVQVRNEVREEY